MRSNYKQIYTRRDFFVGPLYPKKTTYFYATFVAIVLVRFNNKVALHMLLRTDICIEIYAK